MKNKHWENKLTNLRKTVNLVAAKRCKRNCKERILCHICCSPPTLPINAIPWPIGAAPVLSFTRKKAVVSLNRTARYSNCPFCDVLVHLALYYFAPLVRPELHMYVAFS